MTSTSHPSEIPLSAVDEEAIPCPVCGTGLSRYVSKCPKCGHHAHRLSHDEVATQRARQQRRFIVWGALATFALVAALVWVFGGGLRDMIAF